MSDAPTKNLKLAVLALQDEFPGLTENSLQQALSRIQQDNNAESIPKIYRRKEVAAMLGISLREVDRLITPVKVAGRIIAPCRLTTIQLGPRAIGILKTDLIDYIQNSRRKG